MRIPVRSVRRFCITGTLLTSGGRSGGAQELTDLVGVTRQTVNAIEGNRYSRSLEVAFRIAQVFDVPLKDVFQYAAK